MNDGMQMLFMDVYVTMDILVRIVRKDRVNMALIRDCLTQPENASRWYVAAILGAVQANLSFNFLAVC